MRMHSTLVPAVLTTAATTAVFLGSSAHGQVHHAAGQEQVADFGALVPQQHVETTLPYDVALERVTTAIPWGRGMAIVDGELLVLSRGRHRGEGGVDQHLVDAAGTLWRVDRSVSEPVVPGEWAGAAVRSNVEVFAEPTSPPFYLYDYSVAPEDDYLMSRPYCALAYDEASRNLFVCAYSGAELPNFRKHATDAVYRYDLRDEAWHVVEQHDPNVVPQDELGPVVSSAYYPHHDPATNAPPHGWVNGADGCIGAGDYLYVPAKDNHLIVQYDLDAIRKDAGAGAPDSRPVLDASMIVQYPGGEQEMELLGPSGVAVHDDYLYIGYRTSSVVVRVPLDAEGDLVRGADGRVRSELIGVFEPWCAETQRSGNLYDIDMSADGELFVSMGTEGKIWRFMPDPARPFYGNDQSERPTTAPPFLDMTALVGRGSGSNNIYVDRDGGYLYISNRNDDTGEGRVNGTIYRVSLH